MLPESMWLSVWIAGIMLFIMSMMDTLAYGVRTAGVLARRLAISLSLFNALVVFSRLSNLLQAPVLGTFSDGTYKGNYTTADVVLALRYDLLFVVAGVLLGALLMPTFVKLFQRGIVVLEDRGSAPRTAWYALAHLGRLPAYAHFPSYSALLPYFSIRNIPYNFLIFNIFVTAFYSIGVMSTVLAASLDHSVASTAILLSGIVNGMATMLLFIIVDPPAAIVIDQCINGKRPVKDAKTLNLYLVLTRLLGTLLALVLLPVMGNYVLHVARWVTQHWYTAANGMELERFHPLLMYSLLTATQRFDETLYADLCHKYQLDPDRVRALFTSVEQIGIGQLPDLMEDLRLHPRYDEIVFLAGRNALLGWAEARDVKLARTGGPGRFPTLVSKLLPAFCGRSEFYVSSRKSLVFVDIRDSVFARAVRHETPLCGFYAGFLAELASGCEPRNCEAVESQCGACDENATSCVFQVAL